MTFFALFVFLGCLVCMYALIAACLCVYLDHGTNWWCPLCGVLRLFSRRISR